MNQEFQSENKYIQNIAWSNCPQKYQNYVKDIKKLLTLYRQALTSIFLILGLKQHVTTFLSVDKTVNSLGSPPVSRKTIWYYYTAPNHYGVVISIPCVIAMNISKVG